VRRDYENAAKLSREEHSATVARLETSHTATITGTTAGEARGPRIVVEGGIWRGELYPLPRMGFGSCLQEV